MWQYVWTIGRKMNFEQRVDIFKPGKTAAETHQIMLKVYCDQGLSRLTIYEWFERAKEGWEDLNDDEHSGRRRSAVNKDNLEIVRQFIKKRTKIFVPKGQILNTVFYPCIMKRLLVRIRRVLIEWNSIHYYTLESNRQSAEWLQAGGSQPKRTKT